MNDETALQGRPAASPITCTDDTNEVGLRDYPRCESCGRRFPTSEFLKRHRIRACLGPVGERRVVMMWRGGRPR